MNVRKDVGFQSQRPYKLAHQILCVTAFNFRLKSLIGYVELSIHPLKSDLRRIRINSKQSRIYRVSINELWDADFLYNDPTLEISQGQWEKRNLDHFEQCQTSAMRAVDADSGNGEVTIKLPTECFALVADLQPFRLTIEFSLEQPKGGLHFVVPNLEGSLVDKAAHLFTYGHENSSRLWFPCADTYSEPCTWKLEFTVDLEMTAVSCGDLLEVVYTPDRKQKTYHYFLSTPTAAPNIALAVGPFEMLVDTNMHEVTHFCLPHMKNILKHTTRYIHEAFEFYEELMSSRYPYSCYKQVFVDEAYEDVQAYATMAIFSVNLLHSQRIIDQTVVTRECMAYAVAQQFFGSFIAMQTWCDAWLPKGIASYLANLFVKKTFGNNEYRHTIAQYLKEVQEYEKSVGGIVLDPSSREAVFLYFSTQQPHTTSPSYIAMYNKKALLIMRMLETRVGPTLLLQVFNKLLALAYSASQEKFIANAWGNMLLSTNSFLKIISTVTGKDIQPFIDMWVSQSGCARFIGSFVFNRKRNVVELDIKQDAMSMGSLKYAGPLEVTIQELDGSFSHTFMIEENRTKFEITCHSKSRRNKKKKIPLLTGEEVDMDLSAMDADSPVLWLRMDPSMNLFRHITWEQPDYMWQYQLRYERDVIAQSESIQALRLFSTAATRKALTDVLENEQCFYKVRIESSICLTKVANSMVSSWAGPPAMMMIFRKMFGSHSCQSIIKQNSFTNFQHYFILQAIPISMAQLRNVHNICPPEVVRFLLELFKYNDNTKNKYSDNYYRSSLIDALANTITPAVTTVTITGQNVNHDLSSDTKQILEEVTRCLNLEKLLPCYRHTVTVSCLRAIRTLQKFGHLPSDAAIFRSYARHGVFRDVRVVAIEALVDFIKTDVNVAELYWLLEVVERDPDTYVRHQTLQLLYSNPPFKRAEESLLNTEALVNRLWKLMNSSLSHDSRLRCGVADFYFVLFGRFRPSCLSKQENMINLSFKEKKPMMINPAIVSETLTDMFEEDDDAAAGSAAHLHPPQPTAPPRIPTPHKHQPEENVIIDVDSLASETDSPLRPLKRKVESPPGGPPAKSLMLDKVGAEGEDSSGSSFRLKIKGASMDENAQLPTPVRTDAPSIPALQFGPVGSDSHSRTRLSEDSNSSRGDSSLSRPGPLYSGKPDGPTSFHGLFSSASSGLITETVSMSTSSLGAPGSVTFADSDSFRKHKKKKKKNKHKQKHKSKHRSDKDRSRDRETSREMSRDRENCSHLSQPSPMVSSVQSYTSMSSMDVGKESNPSSPEFEVI